MSSAVARPAGQPGPEAAAPAEGDPDTGLVDTDPVDTDPVDTDLVYTDLVDVLHVINGEFYAGAERVQELLAERLPGFGYRARFVCLKRGQFQQALELGPHPSVAVTMGSRLDILRHARTIARHARDTGCRLIHTHTPRSALVGSLAAAFARLPMVHHVHSPTSRDSARRVTNRVNAAVERASLVRAQALIPVSESLGAYLREQGYRADRIVTIPNGVAVVERARSDRPRPAGHLTAGTVALFRPRKGIEVLLEALALLAAEGAQVRLVAVGPFETPDYEASVRRLGAELGIGDRVEWRGFRHDVAGELSNLDVMVLPSLFGEGMPMVVLEAMSMGVPVVATQVEGVPEVIRDGIDGVLVAPGDPRALAGAIARLAEAPDTLAAMGRSGQRRQREHYSDVAMAKRLAGVYDRLIGREGRGRNARC